MKAIVVSSMKEYDVEGLVGNLDFESGKLQNVGNGIFLTNKEIEVLKSPYINAFCMLNENMFLTGDNNGTIKQWKNGTLFIS